MNDKPARRLSGEDQSWRDRKVTYPNKQDLILPDFNEM